MHPIAHIHNDFKSKFGIPRQSGLVPGVKACIVFCPEFRNAEALRGLEEFSHIWLLWDFSEAHSTGAGWSPTVRPPRLGGNRRMGVWATRSPFRPNNIGLSCVRLIGIEHNSPEGPVLHVEGADLLDGTPILDIKPYLPFTDSHPEASAGWTAQVKTAPLRVTIPAVVRQNTPATASFWLTLEGILKEDPRPHYQNDPERTYSFDYQDYCIRFRVDGQELTVVEIVSN